MKPGAQGAISLNSAPVDEKFVPFVAKQPHVVQAVGVLSAAVELWTAMNGVDIPQFEKISGGFRFVEGGLPRGPDDLLVDESYARQNHLHIGQTVSLLGPPVASQRNCGRRYAGAFAAPIRTLQEVTGNTNRISEILSQGG